MEPIQNVGNPSKAKTSNSAVATFLINEEGVITLAGKFDVSLLGLKTDFAIGKSIFDVFADNPDLVKSIRCALAGK